MTTPSRITLARQRRGLRISALARDLEVARQTVAAWETGDQIPTAANLAALGERLQFPVEFFTRGDVEPLPIGAVSFRALSKMTASTRDVALAAGRTALLIDEWLAARYRLPEPDVPTLGLQPPEQAAEALRHRWGLGNAPISNMTHLLEAKGVRIFSLPEECRTVDAYSLRWHGTPVVLLTPGKSAERRRFDLAHELAHLVLHAEREHFQGPKAEDEANRFASSFLMPRRGMLGRPLRHATIDMILTERRRWKVAAMALTYRLNELGFLTEWEYRNHCIALSRRGFRRSEPGGINHESSQLLSKITQSLRRKGIGTSQLATQVGVTVEELSSYLLGLVVMPIANNVHAHVAATGDENISPRHLHLA
ncbi:MAG: XRE family transcriptional regulator [Pseudonocardiales bacterium]|nr:MAG: XRE family transcriptional regulator [Pseudonocardiales bacterium]